MGILLIFVGIVVLISMIVFGCIFSGERHRKISYIISASAMWSGVWAAIFALVYGMVTLIALSNSYDSYINARAYYDNLIAQYKGAIVLYEDKAVSLDMEKAVSHGLTDMRYQGYQDKMGDFILDLRKSITDYNSTIIKKHLMKKNFFYSWYIILPDADMHTIDIVDKN